MPKESNIQITKQMIRYSFIGVCLIAFSLLIFWMRTLPIATIVTGDWVNLLGNDPWYSLRQIEQITTAFPSYSWFDPMTRFPFGQSVSWGPLYPIMAAFLCILMGATTRPEMMYAASFLSPLMAAAMVPVMYGLGAKLVDWKTGLVSAGFIAVVSGQYAYRSLFGFVDHHIAETLFSALFCLCFIIALMKIKESKISINNLQSLKNPAVIYPIIAGVAFLLGFYNMTTMIIFGVVVVLFTIIQSVLDHIKEIPIDYIIITNCITFLVVFLGILPFGLQSSDFSLWHYSYGHPLLYGLIIIGSLVIYGFSRWLRVRPWYFFPASLVCLTVVSLVSGLIVIPDLVSGYLGMFSGVFGMGATTLTIQEAMPWQFENAVSVFNWGWILVAGGIIYLLYRIWKQLDAPALFTLIWFALIFLATTRQVRFEYYLAANIALIAALAVGGTFSLGGRDLLRLAGMEKLFNPKEEEEVTLPEVPEEKGKRGKKQVQKNKVHTRPSAHPIKPGLLVVTIIIALLFTWSGATANVTLGSNVGGGMNGDWKAALTWLGANSSDPGVDYYTTYTSQEGENYEYPPGSYGVISWWDYGHWITFVSQRIPVANPFQAGATTAAHFFMETDGEEASSQLDNLGVKYVITDIEMTTGKFWAMTTWHDPVNATDPFQKRMLYQESESSGSFSMVNLQRESYFQTMIQRLHVFDGSETPAGEIIVVQSAPASELGLKTSSYPVITGVQQAQSTAEAQAYIEEFKKTAKTGYNAEILTPEMFVSPTELDALQRFRLVYESPTNVLSGGGDIRYVKIFEFVPGATVQGEGTIEVPIMTNTGRTFTYRQTSKDGVFVLPYPTVAGPDDAVVAVGPYRMVESGEEIVVSYRAVMEGLRI
ncbi:MAG: oligosaccharyl transferase, archaeosortase A system-associated [Methanocalculus sp.]|uniref:oligosaccharyl transferase, archaeosortase A system-associated n=1 Tax=Methanocalculus sp. TaxID=2004547 RepID=UPI002727E985|nr:oligosaccharyl transferase, archaeosortase A system-associated [Methanocalculus sp.]MDO9539452.1 oligosaccharyl transferase, archaeosortase A system-associated [Methanocalculus sp.]